MSIHIRRSPLQEPESDSYSSEDDDDADENWDDWVSDSVANPCKSLFDNDIFPSATDALQNDKSKHNFDLDDVCKRLGSTLCLLNIPLLTSDLGLDFHGRTRLINYIRKQVRISISPSIPRKIIEIIETIS